MADSDNSQQQTNQNQQNQRSNTPSQPAPKPSIPPSADQSLASNISKGLNNNSQIPEKPDPTLNSAKTANEEGLKTIK